MAIQHNLKQQIRQALWNTLHRVRKWPVPRSAPALIILALVGAILIPNLAVVTFRTTTSVARALPGAIRDAFPRQTSIAPLFTDEVHYWEPEIQKWAAIYEIEPNLLATVMQIESCGHPTVSSPAGAQGLFQVMPFHFSPDENMLHPDTNAMRGAFVLSECSRFAGGDVGLTLACYNGGPGVINASSWVSEVRRYYHWGTGIYADALTGKSNSQTLTDWLQAGGGSLCDLAAAEIGLS